MPNFQTVSEYYLPSNFLLFNERNYRSKQIELENARFNLISQTREKQEQIRLIIREILHWFETQTTQLDYPILYIGYYNDATDESSFPYKVMKKKLTDLLLNQEILPQDILSLFQNILLQYQHNNLPYNYQQDLSLRAKYEPTIIKAREVGEILERAFNQQFIPQLNVISEALSDCQQIIDRLHFQLQEISPKTKLLQNLKITYEKALEILFQEADTKVKQYSVDHNDACGIRGLCGELILLKHENRPTENELKRRIRNFSTLSNIKENSYAATQIYILKHIINAHTENLTLLERNDFEVNLLENDPQDIRANDNPAINDTPMESTHYSFYLQCLVAVISGSLLIALAFILMPSPFVFLPMLVAGSTLLAGGIGTLSYGYFFNANAERNTSNEEQNAMELLMQN